MQDAFGRAVLFRVQNPGRLQNPSFALLRDGYPCWHVLYTPARTIMARAKIDGNLRQRKMELPACGIDDRSGNLFHSLRWSATRRQLICSACSWGQVVCAMRYGCGGCGCGSWCARTRSVSCHSNHHVPAMQSSFNGVPVTISITITLREFHTWIPGGRIACLPAPFCGHK